MLLKKVDLLESQTRQYRLLVKNCEESDSLNLKLLEDQDSYYISKLASLNKDIRKEHKRKNLYKAGMLGTLGAAILALIFIK